MTKKQLLITEITIWLIVIILITIGGYFGINKFLSQRPVYSVIFQDVNGLGIGSPVRFMGIQVGHILTLKPVYDEVYLTFVITKPNVKIPQGTLASIQSSGMAGSRSLELIPSKPNYLDLTEFVVIEPIRINSLYEVQNKVLESSTSYSKVLADFIGDNASNQFKDTIKKTFSSSKSLTANVDDIDKSLNSKNKAVILNFSKIKNSLKKWIKTVENLGFKSKKD